MEYSISNLCVLMAQKNHSLYYLKHETRMDCLLYSSIDLSMLLNLYLNLQSSVKIFTLPFVSKFHKFYFMYSLGRRSDFIGELFNSSKTLSWRKVYLPCISAVLHALKTCAVVLICFPHKLQQASELIRQRFGLLGEGRTS